MYNNERVTAYFKDPNVFAAYMVPPILLFSGMILRRSTDKRLYFSMSVLLGLLVAAFFFAYSRAAYLNIAAAVLTYVTILAVKRKVGLLRKAMISYLIAAGVTIGLAISLNQVPMVLQRLQLYQEYDIVRFDVQRQAWLEFVSNSVTSSSLWLGIGPGEFEAKFLYASHSLYFRVILENGLLGFGSLALLIILSLSRLFSTVRATEEHGSYSSEILAAVVGTLVNSFFIDSLHWRHFWTLLALAWVPIASQGGFPDRILAHYVDRSVT